jgi:DNA-binding response OmpR family regulator
LWEKGGGSVYRLLIVEDDAGIAGAVGKQAEMWDFSVKIVEDFRRVLEDVAAFDPHIVLLDISLPFYDGYYWCGEIRKRSKVPIIFISSAADNINIVMAMNMGADDFIAKPFDQSVLMAKIQALLRRTYAFAASVPVLEHRGALLNTGDATLTYGEEKIPLTKNEYRILLCLMENRARWSAGKSSWSGCGRRTASWMTTP